jgi:hypothetical protein
VLLIITRRLQHKRQKAKGKGQKAKMKTAGTPPLVFTFAF